MTLIARVQARVSTQKLIELTNINTRASGLSVNTTTLQLAVDDSISDLRTFANVAYDDTDGRHVAAAVLGVILYLKTYKLEAQADDRLEKWQKRIKDGLRMVTHNDRIKPKSSSQLTPAEESLNGIEVRPHFDTEVGFADLIPGKDERDRRLDRGIP